LAEEAWEVVTSQGRGVSTSGPLLAAGPGAAAGGARQRRAEREARAQGSQALSQLLQLVGLEPVKQQMFSLADQVREGTGGNQPDADGN
jgi:hypothetical protein